MEAVDIISAEYWHSVMLIDLIGAFAEEVGREYKLILRYTSFPGAPRVSWLEKGDKIENPQSSQDQENKIRELSRSYHEAYSYPASQTAVYICYDNERFQVGFGPKPFL